MLEYRLMASGRVSVRVCGMRTRWGVDDWTVEDVGGVGMDVEWIQTMVRLCVRLRADTDGGQW